MSPIEFLRASHSILSTLLESESRQASDAYLSSMLKGEYGDDVLTVLLEIQIALERSASLATLPSKTRSVLYDFETTAFKALSTSGIYDDAVTVLSERMQGPEGVSVMAAEEFKIIAANMSHIDAIGDGSQEQYWRKRIKDYKYSLIREFRNYITTAREAAHATSDSFNTATSELMNILLENKHLAENQQQVLIEAKSGAAQTNNYQLAEMNLSLLGDFLQEAAAGSNAVLFARRLQSMIDRCIPLQVFEEAYGKQQALTGNEWRAWRELIKNYELNCRMVLVEFERRIDELIDVMDFHNLPEEINLDDFTVPLVNMTKHIFAIMRELADTWLHATKDAITSSQTALHGN